MTLGETQATLGAEKFSALLVITRALAAQIRLDELLQLIVTKTSALLEAERSTVFIVDRDARELWSQVAQLSELTEIRLGLDGPGLAAHVARTGEALNLPDAYQDPRFNRDVDRATGWHTGSMLVMPMLNHQGEIIGVFQVMNKRGGFAFGVEDEELLSSLSASAAIAVENAQLYEEQRRFFYSFVETMAATIDAKDRQTSGHTGRVTRYAVILATELDLSPSEIEIIRLASLLHDYGKIGIPDAILTKPGKLTDEEYAVMRQHARYTKEILDRIRFPRGMREIPPIAAQHHERPDGRGAPWGLRGDEIVFGSRIIAVADVFDALTSRRYYKDPIPMERAIQIIIENAGTQFDPTVVEAFKRALPALTMAVAEMAPAIEAGR